VLLLDFSQVTFVNSSGMGALIEYWRAARRFGGYFAIVGLNKNLLEIFHIVRLDDNMWLFPSLESAMGAIAEVTEIVGDSMESPFSEDVSSRGAGTVSVARDDLSRRPEASLSEYP
jgi:hypothetical protein